MEASLLYGPGVAPAAHLNLLFGAGSVVATKHFAAPTNAL